MTCKDLHNVYDILEKPIYHSCLILSTKQETKSLIKISGKQKNGWWIDDSVSYRTLTQHFYRLFLSEINIENKFCFIILYFIFSYNRGLTKPSTYLRGGGNLDTYILKYLLMLNYTLYLHFTYNERRIKEYKEIIQDIDLYVKEISFLI